MRKLAELVILRRWETLSRSLWSLSPLWIIPLTKEPTLGRKPFRDQEVYCQHHRFMIWPQNPTALARKLMLTWGWACVFYANLTCSRALGDETSGSTKNHLSSLLLFLAIKDPANSLLWWRAMSGFSLLVIQNHYVCDFTEDIHLAMAWSCLFWLFSLGFPLSSPSQSSPPPRLDIFFLTQPCL